MASKRPDLSGFLEKVARRIESCGKLKNTEGLRSSDRDCLLFDCSERSAWFDVNCLCCMQNRRAAVIEGSAKELLSLYENLFNDRPDAPWLMIKDSVTDAICYEVLRLSHKRYEEHRQLVLSERQNDAIKGCHPRVGDIENFNEREGGTMASKRQEEKKPDKEKKTTAKEKKTVSGQDKIAKLLEGKTQKQMIEVASKFGVDKDKIAKVKEAVNSGLGLGLTRMRIGNLMRGASKK